MKTLLKKFASATLNFPLMGVLVIGNVIFVLIALFGLLLDTRTILSAPVWAKTFKFALSAIVYGLTYLIVDAELVELSKKAKKLLSWASGILIIEMIIIITQAIRGKALHFNNSTLFDSFSWYTLSFLISIFFILNFITCITLLRRNHGHSLFNESIKLGITISLIGFALGFLMTFPTKSQWLFLTKGIHLDFIGAHNTNAFVDGQTRMIPLLGWNKDGGDLRIPHFVGMHGLQFMIILASIIFYFGNKFSILFKKQVALVWVGFVFYLGITLLVTWQALKNESIVSPSISTIAIFSTWSSAAILAVLIIFYSPSRKTIKYSIPSLTKIEIKEKVI